MTNKITILLEWDTCQPDNRQYKQPSQVLLPRLPVAVDVPLEHIYFHNSEAIIQAQIAGENAAAPVLTPKGMRYVVDQLEAQFQEDDFKGGQDLDITEGWDDEEETETGTGSTSSDDEWGDESEDKTSAAPSDDTEGWGEEKSDDFDVDDEWGDD